MGSTNTENPPFPLTEKDKWILSQTDEEYEYHDWEGLRQIIGKYPCPPHCLPFPPPRYPGTFYRLKVSLATPPPYSIKDKP